MEAETESAAIGRLRQMGYSPISVSRDRDISQEQPRRASFFRNIRHRDLTTFTRQLSNLLESGLTLYRALTVLQQQTENRRLKVMVEAIAEQVKEGKSFSVSLKNYPRCFNNMYVSMVNSGEVSGTLNSALSRLADFREKQEDILAKVQAAMAYPILMATVGTATIVVLFTFVIPKLVSLFEDMGQILPLPTSILIAISDFFLDFWWLLLAVAGFIFFAIRRNLFTARGKLSLEHFRLGLPVLGEFYKRVQIANFSRTLATLLTNGIPILPAMDSVAQTVESEVLRQEIRRIAGEIKAGSTLAQGISRSRFFPVLVANIITIAEEAGTLEAALFKVADIYEKETDQSVKLLSSLIEPTMILIMGAIVGAIVISMLLPIFQISLIAR